MKMVYALLLVFSWVHVARAGDDYISGYLSIQNLSKDVVIKQNLKNDSLALKTAIGELDQLCKAKVGTDSFFANDGKHGSILQKKLTQEASPTGTVYKYLFKADWICQYGTKVTEHPSNSTDSRICLRNLGRPVEGKVDVTYPNGYVLSLTLEDGCASFNGQLKTSYPIKSVTPYGTLNFTFTSYFSNNYIFHEFSTGYTTLPYYSHLSDGVIRNVPVGDFFGTCSEALEIVKRFLTGVNADLRCKFHMNSVDNWTVDSASVVINSCYDAPYAGHAGFGTHSTFKCIRSIGAGGAPAL